VSVVQRIAVYLGSSPGPYATLAADVGRRIAERGLGIVYGGGRRGMMGALADAALAAGGEVVGVIPQAMVEREVAHEGATELVVVSTMHERKEQMSARADAFLTLPGGTGTLDEFVEALSWTQLGLHAKPSGLLNVDGYYDGLVAYFERAARDGYLPEDFDRLLLVDDDVDRLLDRFDGWAPPASRRWLDPV
jgi:uncharacterized protein (TIGR00730 family)